MKRQRLWRSNRAETFRNIVPHPPEPTRHWAVQEVQVWPDGRVQAALLSPDEMKAWIVQQAAYITKRNTPLVQRAVRSQIEILP